MKFSYAPKDLGDFGHFTDSGDFCCEGNLFTDRRSLSLKTNITPMQHKISERAEHQRESGVDRAYHYPGGFTELYKPLGRSLPNISS
ncbi:hypothetical protein SCLCIDRAFT_754726 [Scleroderma citrinum Foug A]|uniref:Uncharacterized protein n=1 Tax=Scleroderma citrinum Foug A TaxID=1036808 RepID=A0A0C3E4H0_9AGAM|nr:hypothetical protein SCLCIDRAFT_754726 [Scleroderma citrinum Foug A]